MRSCRPGSGKAIGTVAIAEPAGEPARRGLAVAAGPAQSLQQRALGWLAQREHSRAELRRKLLRAARAPAGGDEGDAASDSDERVLALVDRLLDQLEQRGLLSEQRFVESRLRLRAPAQGARRIEAELARHGLKLQSDERQRLRDSEFERALALWQRRFGVAATQAADRARQMRFLAGRGFDADVIRRVMRAAGNAPAD